MKFVDKEQQQAAQERMGAECTQRGPGQQTLIGF